MDFRLSFHVRNRMRQRGVTEDDVRHVLDKPLTTWHDPVNRSRVFRGTAMDGRALKVCLVDPVPPDGVEVVKTTMWA